MSEVHFFGELVPAAGLALTFSAAVAASAALMAARRRAARSASRLAAALDAEKDTIVIFDAKDRVVFFNASAHRIYAGLGIRLRLGMTYREVLSEALAAGLCPEGLDDPEGWTRAALELFRQDRHDILTRNGRHEEILQLKLPGGETMRRHADVTAKVQRKEEIEESRVQLAQQAEDLRLLAMRAEAASEAKSEFITRMSHAMLTPLNAISGYANLLAARDLSAMDLEHVETIRHAAAHLTALSDDLVDFSRLEAEGVALRLVEVDVADCLVKLLSIARRLPGTLNIGSVIAPDTPRRVVLDCGRLEQLLLRLIEEAARRSHAGSIVVHVGAAGEGRIRFDVETHGVSIRENQLMLFGEAAAPDDPKGRTGLAFAARLVALMQGSLAVHALPDMGMRFRVDLPASTVTDEAEDETACVQKQAPLDILVADDVKSARQLLKMLLERDGHRVVVVEDGIQALGEVRMKTFDVILLDLEMPRLDGFATARAIRDMPGQHRPFIFACTAQVFDQARAKANEAGMDGFVAKPVQPASLRTLLASVTKK